MLAFYYNFCTIKLELLNSLAGIQLRWGVVCVKGRANPAVGPFAPVLHPRRAPNQLPMAGTTMFSALLKPQRRFPEPPTLFSVLLSLWKLSTWKGHSRMASGCLVFRYSSDGQKSLQKTAQHLHIYNSTQLIKVSCEFRHPWLCQLLWWE